MVTAVLDNFEIVRLGDVYRVNVMTEGFAEPSAVLILDPNQARLLAHHLSTRIDKDMFEDFRTRSVNVIPFSDNKRRKIRRPRRAKPTPPNGAAS